MSLVSQLAEDLAPAFGLGALGREIIYNGAPATGIFSSGPETSPDRSRDSTAVTGILRVLKSEVKKPGYRDTVEIDGISWHVISVLSSTVLAWKLWIERDRRVNL